jgi:hypothetical protein
MPASKLINGDESNDMNQISDKLFKSMKSNKEAFTLKYALYKRSLKRPSRKEEESRSCEYDAVSERVYKELCYKLFGSHVGDGGGALPLSEQTAARLADKFFHLFHELDEQIVILLV